MSAPTRFLRALRPARPVRRHPGTNKPMHYTVPGGPTRYIPTSGLLTPPEELPGRPRAAESRPRLGRGPGRPAFLADPYFGPGLAAVAAILWVVGLHPVPPSAIGAIGLIANLSIPTLLAYPLLIASVVLELLRYQPRTWFMSGYTLLGVVFVYGLQPAVEEVARLPTAWLHSGFAEYIANHGEVLQGYDARFSWAGFFSLIAMVTKAAGIPNALSLINWAPVVLAGLMVLGTRALAVSALGNRRASWFAPWLFLVGDWTEQDYFSPQATAMVLMLAALTLTFRHLVRPRLTEPVRARMRVRLAPRSSPKARLVAQGSVVLIGLGLAPTHQLTPFVLAGMLLLLLLFGRLWPAWLPFVVFGAAVVWFSLGASDFWTGQLVQMLLSPLGDVSASVDQGLFSRLSGDIGHLVVLLVRIAASGFVALLAALGIILMRRDNLRSWLLPVLCAAPFGLALVQSYGGEVFMRCFLFALPIMALPASILLERALTEARKLRWRNRPSRTMAVAGIPWLVLTLLATMTLIARGGNDAYTSMSKQDVAAASWAIGQARPGQRVDSLVNAVPLAFARVGEVDQSEADIYCTDLVHVPAAVECLQEKGPDYLVVTEPQFAYLKILNAAAPDYEDQLLRGLQETQLYRVVFNDEGALVLGRASVALQNVQPAEGGTG
ncbi:hypothetical protein FHX82_003677 [Amycolatopsis bartoniae]|uniref:Uncharacterized protein n=1 Tax=Amycolatopsis bartoniae TaxID=941986 RepID=A0A8H9MBV5_9PSEU|nr:hypothetical protein [Amycolatopsis bartoniae]MBB2936613.1 hypothetical protein [Amycolatopsis bartoniae]TVT09801.1 hypothetical protein FNH07_07645 [Amycolatopsis bartoniae]GHF67665.1 hypothetical protein GCM10017566_46740 [Amycolatopsis bartoniae]